MIGCSIIVLVFRGHHRQPGTAGSHMQPGTAGMPGTWPTSVTDWQSTQSGQHSHCAGRPSCRCITLASCSACSTP